MEELFVAEERGATYEQSTALRWEFQCDVSV